MCHKLDLGPNSLSGAQHYTTVEAAETMKIQDNSMKVQDTENAQKAHLQNANGQYKCYRNLKNLRCNGILIISKA